MIVNDLALNDMQNMICHLLKTNWQPLGGVCVLNQPKTGIMAPTYYQALVKYAEEE